MQIKQLCLAFAGMTTIVVSVLAQEKPLPLDPAVRSGKLSNGFTYYIRHNEEPKNRVVFYLANKVGSILETGQQCGLAHFIEHMSFNGTKHFPKNELVDYLQRSGVRFGADLNAYTSFDETVYQLPLPTDKPDILKNGIQIMRDWAQDATLDQAEIDKERGVILEEKRLGKGAAERMRMQYWPTVLNGSLYAERIPIGLEDVIQNFKPETIRSFYHDWYRPDLQALIVVGDINVDEMEKVIKEKFGDLKNPEGEKSRTKYTVPLIGKNQFMSVTDKEMTAISAEVIIKHKTEPVNTISGYRNVIVTQLFDQMLGERLADLSRKADPPFIQGNAGIQGFLGGLDSFNASVVVKPGGLEEGIKAVWRETERVKRFGFTATELARAKQSYLRRMESSFKEKGKINSTSYVKQYLNCFLKEEAAPGIDAQFDIVQTALPKITLVDMDKLSQTYIVNINRDILLLAPEKDKANLPDEGTVNGWFRSVEAEDLKPYNDEVTTKSLLIKIPQPGKVIHQEKSEALGITTLAFSNGVKVILKPTAFKNNEILFNAFSPGGTSLYPDVDYQSAANASGIIQSFGAGNYNIMELSKYLSGKQIAVQPYISERAQGVNGQSTPTDLETALELMYAFLTEPRKDENIFKNIIQRSKVSLSNRENDPEMVYKDSVSAVLGGYNIRRTAPTIGKLEQIDLNRAYHIYQERFADASGTTFIFVGSIDVDTIKPLLEKYIGSLPATNSHQTAKDLGMHPPRGHIEKKVYKGTEPKATVQLYFTGDFNYSALERKRLNALKEVLEFRLLERLREDESGVYTPSVSAASVKLPNPRYSFTVAFGCAPQNVDKLIVSTLDEVNKLKTAGPPRVNIDKYKAEDQRSHETELKTNRWWLGYLNNQLQENEPLDQLYHYTDEMKQITVESVKKTAKRYLSGKNYIQIVLLPESEKNNTPPALF